MQNLGLRGFGIPPPQFFWLNQITITAIGHYAIIYFTFQKDLLSNLTFSVRVTVWINSPWMRCRRVIQQSLWTESALNWIWWLPQWMLDHGNQKNSERGEHPSHKAGSKEPAFPHGWKHISQAEKGLVKVLVWSLTQDLTGHRALKQNNWTQTQRQLDEWETGPPSCLTDRPHPPFIENQIPHHQHHDCDINSQACRSLYLFSTTTKETQVLFCIHEAADLHYHDSSASTGLIVSSWVSRVVRSGLWSHSAAKTPKTFNRACGICATTVSQVIQMNGAFENQIYFTGNWHV